MYWLLLSGFAISFSTFIGKYFGNKSFQAIDKFGRYSIFEITNGDKDLREEYKKRNRNELIKFIVHVGFSIIINVIAGIITYNLVK